MPATRLLPVRGVRAAEHALLREFFAFPAVASIRSEGVLLESVVATGQGVVGFLRFARHPVHRQRRPLERMSQHQVVEKRRILFPDLPQIGAVNGRFGIFRATTLNGAPRPTSSTRLCRAYLVLQIDDILVLGRVVVSRVSCSNKKVR